MAQFKKAIKGLKPLRLVIGGASGSGKSKTASIFADYLSEQTGKRTAAVDTEHGRLSLYADEFDFDVFQAEPPFHPSTLVKLIHDAEEAGYGQLIIDSSTHFYSGTGGLLEIVSEAAKQKFGGNQYYAWAVGTPLHNTLIDTIIRSPLHVIITSRSKQKYVENEKNGKKTYEKVGEDMIQKDGLEYEFDFCLMMDMDHTARVSKGLNEVDTSVYFKMAGREAIEKIMTALQSDSVVIVDVKPLKKQIKDLIKQHPDSLDEYKKIFSEFGNPNEIEDATVLNTIVDRMNELK